MITVLKDTQLKEIVGGYKSGGGGSSGFASRLDNFMDKLGVPQRIQTVVFRVLGLHDPDRTQLYYTTE